MSVFNLAIVGAGAAGTSLLANLFPNHGGPGSGVLGRVAVLDPGEPGVGQAFGVERDELLCNTSVGVNSLYAGAPDHLLGWLRNRLALWRPGTGEAAELSRSSFVSRRVYRAYLSEQLAAACNRASDANCTVDFLRERVVEIAHEGALCRITTATGRTLHARSVVLATGMTLPARRWPGLCRESGFAPSPFAVPDYKAFLDGCEEIAIIGTRQSAIDAALMVASTAPNCRVTLYSRSGRFPAVRSSMVEHPLAHFAPDRLAPGRAETPAETARTWRDLLRRDLLDACAHAPGGVARLADAVIDRHASAYGITQLHEDLIRTCESGPGGAAWERIDRGAVTAANAVWPLLNPAQKQAVTERLGPFVRRYVSAIPAVNAQRLLALSASGRLRVNIGPGRICADRPTGGIRIEDAAGTERRVDRVINATGFVPARGRAPLLVDGRPLASALRHVDPTTLRIRSGSAASVHVVGPPLRRVFAITNYMNATVRQAALLAKQLAAEQGRRPSRQVGR